MIHCFRGWVRLVYEDQGPPFVLQAGDCVLQPPQIRHRVLESSPGLEVIELACPAAHDTCADHDLALPGPSRPEREFGGQRFVHHVAADAPWRPWRLPGFECRDTGIGAATSGLAGARVVRSSGAGGARGARPPRATAHDAELLFLFVLQGALTLEHERKREPLATGDAAVIPAGQRHAFCEPSEGLELLEVSLPAEVGRVEEW
jgi:quercetin dioxygenase-like cupin family protein